MTRSRPNRATRCVHAGRPRRTTGGAAPPIFPASVNVFESLEDTIEAFSRPERFLYARYGHPTGTETEARLAAVAGTQGALLFSSGMAALALSIFAHCGRGDHLIASSDLYGGTTALLRGLPARGIEVETVPLDGLSDLRPRLRERTRLILVESPTNPLCRLVDLAGLLDGLGSSRPLVALDETFATPLGHEGAVSAFDLRIHSATKFLGGHDDLLAGAVLGTRAALEPILAERSLLGATCDPHTAWLVERGLKTLSLRWERQCANAGEIARRLEAHPAVERVHYPGLPSHPQHALASRQFPDGGAVLAFDVRGGLPEVRRVMNAFRVIERAPSLGGVTTVTLHPATSSHRALSAEERRGAGIGDGLVRLCIGIEDVDDIWADLDNALAS